MKLPLTSEQYLLLTSCSYVIACLIQIFVVKYTEMITIQMIWAAALAAPLILPLEKLISVVPFWKKND